MLDPGPRPLVDASLEARKEGAGGARGAVPATEVGRVLDVRGLRKSFRSQGGSVEVVRGIDLHAAEGEVLAFLGPNGAGKTTTIKIVAGLIRADAGRVRVGGLDPQTDPRALYQIGAVLEGNRNLYWRLSAAENLEYFGALKGLARGVARRRSHELLRRFELADKSATAVRKLSRGMQQKVALAVALIHRPKLLLLDEPTLGLDPQAAEKVKALIREIAAEERTILLTTHRLDVAEEISRRVAILHRGEIVAEAPTRELSRRFGRDSYRILLDCDVDELRRARVEALGAFWVDGRVEYAGSAEGLYNVLAALRPLPVARLEKRRTGLAEIFLELVVEDDDAGSVPGRAET